jgi:hypothetical protein
VTKNVIKINDYLGVAVKNVLNGNDIIVIRKNNPNLTMKLRHEKDKKRFRT